MSLFTSDQSSSTSKPSLFGTKTKDNGKKPLILSGDLQQDKEALAAITEQERKDAIAKWVKAQYSKCKDQLEPIKRQWYMNMAFHKGDQYCDIVDGMLINVPAPEKRVRLVINRIKPVVRTEVSRMTSQQPSASIVPSTNESKDVEAAKSAEAVFESTKNRKNLEGEIRKAAWWASVTGNAFIKTYWDPDYEESDGTTNMLGEQSVVTGDHCITSVSPFNVLVPDLLEEEIECQPYVLNVFTKPLEWVSTHYPDLVKGGDYKPKYVTQDEIMNPRYLYTKNGNGQDVAHNVLIIEMWIKPGNSKLLPKGGRVVLIDDQIADMQEDGLPYDHGEYPFAKMGVVQTGSFYASSIIEDLIPVQREINRTRSQMVEARNSMAKPGVFYRSNSIDPNKWTSATAQLIEVKPGMEFPQPIPLPQLPSYVPQLEQGFLSDMEDISGQHQVSKGQAPAGVSAGTAIQFLQESDNSFMYTVHKSLEDLVKKVAKQIIELAIQYWDAPRMVKYVGRNNQVSAKYLMQSDLKGATDVKIEGGSSMPESKAARIAMFSDFMARGYVPPDQGLKLMNLPSMGAYYELVDVDENQAIRENIAISELPVGQVQNARMQADQMVQQVQGQLMQGMPPGIDPMSIPAVGQATEAANEPFLPVHEWDNHDVHLMVHERHMKSQEFEDYPDEIKREFELHRQRHLDMRNQKMMQDMFQQLSQNANDPNGDPNGGPPNGDPNAQQGPPNADGNNQFSVPGGPVDTQQPPQ